MIPFNWWGLYLICSYVSSLWTYEEIEQGGGYFWLLFEGTIWLLSGTEFQLTTVRKELLLPCLWGHRWPFGLVQKKPHEQSASAALALMAAFKVKNNNQPMNRRIR